jgi:hypothetical protein
LIKRMLADLQSLAHHEAGASAGSSASEGFGQLGSFAMALPGEVHRRGEQLQGSGVRRGRRLGRFVRTTTLHSRRRARSTAAMARTVQPPPRVLPQQPRAQILNQLPPGRILTGSQQLVRHRWHRVRQPSGPLRGNLRTHTNLLLLLLQHRLNRRQRTLGNNR